ncbi:1-deoxy-D-xylulose-5-phosphate synthase [Fimbriimonas ginsengisoli]|uniref:1-deoxy-D-xylulose-5-phosphate synthase n=1 Tax=Fimbriimonas ginsengisoli Gsoil 348 TaxID=661478 RepID=A0A068NJT5_FIMGI|nr:1-deoxy-D-xylulose-5-phosphate synthase [Fimbriimonas ginsengisoli]AIE83863.1 deoxyxylulose-5-phosphate synthase [Fimbriimonas ginsengisoli Gsoil 348]
MDSAFQHLSQIVQPSDLHRFSDKELRDLANEVRQAILQNVSRTGGHLSSNLGTVELTVAMYASYNIPPDKVVWDTGHQAYPHKLLTGRLPRFDTLRKHKGLSGFLRREEHELDVFGAGHAGTAISAAMGFAAARDRQGTTEKVIAVAGDAAIASGMSWEALNHAGELGTDLCVVLNDNRMSIAPNVGALTNYLAKLRSRPLVQNLARKAKVAIERLGEPAVRAADGLRHGITHYLAPLETGTIFEEIGFEYIGPVDGHDLPTLLEVFRNVRDMNYPVFVHAITVKGKGYEVAEEDARKWHGVVPFDLAACEMVKAAGPVTFTQAFGDATIECAEEDPKVVAITAAMPDGTGLAGYAKKFPDRYYDVGIAEQHAVTFAAGLAAGGMRPFCAIYSTFLQRAYDQVLHDVCLQKLPVRFFLDRAGLVGDDGPTHHGVFDLSYLSPLPNMTILAPRDTTELREMTHWMAKYDAGPTAVRYPRGSSDERLPESRTSIALGKSEVIREGKDLTISAVGSMVSVAYEAAAGLAAQGIEATVINARFLRPLDSETLIGSVSKTKRLITIEENMRSGGFGEACRNALHDAGMGGIPHRLIALPDSFVEHGTQPILREECGLCAAAVIAEAVRLVKAPSR